MALPKRMGPETSSTRAALLDATDLVMREEGYAAVTARRIAERAGLKHQLVYYYFESMDDVFVAAFRRRAEKVVDSIARLLDQPQPLRSYWETFSDPSDAALTLEYLALANHNERIRHETVAFAERIRELEASKLPGQLKDTANPEVVTPFSVLMSITYIALLVGFESTLGIRGGHKEARALLEYGLSRLEP